MVTCFKGLDDIEKYRRFKLLRPDQSVFDVSKKKYQLANPILF